MRVNPRLMEGLSERPRASRPSGPFDSVTNLFQILAFGALMVVVLFFYVPNYKKGEQLQREIAVVQQEIARAQQMNDSLQQEYDLLRSDPETVERAARDRLNLAKTNEVIFRFEPYQSGGPKAP